MSKKKLKKRIAELEERVRHLERTAARNLPSAPVTPWANPRNQPAGWPWDDQRGRIWYGQ